MNARSISLNQLLINWDYELHEIAFFELAVGLAKIRFGNQNLHFLSINKEKHCFVLIFDDKNIQNPYYTKEPLLITL